MSNSQNGHGNGGSSLQDSDDAWAFGNGPGCAAINAHALGLSTFASIVDALMLNPIPGLPIAVGENSTSGATSTVFWEYSKFTGLHLEAEGGYLTTATGNGGFTMDVGTDGSWVLKFAGSSKAIWYDAEDNVGSGPNQTSPPAGNTTVYATKNGNVSANAVAGNITFNGTGSAANPVVGLDTIQGGVGDYMIGGSGGHAVTPAGNAGNCAIYTSSATPVLVDLQNGNGYGGNAEGNSYVNMDQVRGSLKSNVLIGNANGSDLKSGGSNSILISTGGNGYELRPDGTNNTLVSTVGADRVLFDQIVHGTWNPTDTTTMLGFNASHGVVLDLTLTLNTFHSAGSTGNINDYVKLTETASGEKLMFSGTGNVATAGVDILDLALVHGYTAQSLYNSHNLTI